MGDRKRIALFDNLKGYAILLVVCGHLTLRFCDHCNSHVIRTLTTFIYFYHMPLFIFCSGLFAGVSWRKRKSAPSDKVLLYLILYCIFCVAVAVYDLPITGGSVTINPFDMGAAPWFLLALAIMMLLVPLVGSLPTVGTMIALIFLAVAAGIKLPNYTELSLMRVFTYEPYFFLGMSIDPETITSTLRRIDEKIGEHRRRLLGSVLLVAFFLALYFLFDNNTLRVMQSFSTGLNGLPPLADAAGISLKKAAAFRVVEYVLVTVVGFVTILALPTRECLLTKFGERSLQVYFVHIFVMYFFDKTGAIHKLLDKSVIGCMVFVLALGPFLTWLLALPAFPVALVRRLAAWCRRITTRSE